MSDAQGALAFLLYRSTKNRLARQLGRIKRPRYALGAVIGVAYYWFLLARPDGGHGLPPSTNAGFGALVGLGFAAAVLGWWIFAPTGALAFQPAEAQILFTAPLSRRAVLAYRIARSQLVLLVSCVIWTLLIGRWGVTLPWPLRFAAAWVLFTTMGLHRLGVALLEIEPASRERRVARSLGRVVAIGGAAALLIAVGLPLARLGSLGARAAFDGAAAAMAAAPAIWIMAPVQLVMGPLYAASPAAWLPAFGVALGVLALHLVWVLTMDVPFEESATTSSAELARTLKAMRDRASGTPAVRDGKSVRRWLPLAPLGPPAVAIAWKNTLALLRGGNLRAFIVAAVFVVFASRGIVVAREDDPAGPTTLLLQVLALIAFAVGPRLLRNDLRLDLLKLPTLKTYPLDGATLVAAEMASATLVLTALQGGLLLLAWVATPAAARAAFDPVTRTGVQLVAPFLILALNAVHVGVQNGMALLFPSWIRLGADTGGFERMGQMLLVTLGSIVVLAAALVPPGASALFVGITGGRFLGAFALPLALLSATLTLVGELALALYGLGGVFERMDPSELS